MVLIVVRCLHLNAVQVKSLTNATVAEQYLAAKGYSNLTVEAQMSDWRREHMSNLLNAFDFENVSRSTYPSNLSRILF
jgi:hypothetical protein